MSDGKDSKGRFAKGYKGGPGRPRRQTEIDYLIALQESVPIDRWRKIVARALADAENGDPKAREWLGEYLMGKPSGALGRQADTEALLDRKERGEVTWDDLIGEINRM